MRAAESVSSVSLQLYGYEPQLILSSAPWNHRQRFQDQDRYERYGRKGRDQVGYQGRLGGEAAPASSKGYVSALRLGYSDAPKQNKADTSVVDTIFEHLALPPSPYPLIPYPPFSWISALSHPPRAIRFLPFMYRAATWMRDTPLGWAYVEPSARKKYGLPN